jgi:hypothetical protein
LVENNPFLGYVNSFERALEIVKEYELKTTTKFTVYKRSKNARLKCGTDIGLKCGTDMGLKCGTVWVLN